MIMLTNFYFPFNKLFFRYLFKSYCKFGGNDLRCFYQSLLYNSKFCLAPEIIIEDLSSRFYVCKLKSKFIASKILNIKVCSGFRRTTMKLSGKFLRSRRSSLVRGLLPIPGSSSIVRNSGSDLLSRRDISIKLLSCNISEIIFVYF